MSRQAADNSRPGASAPWGGTVEGEEPQLAMHRGNTLQRFGEGFYAGTLWAIDKLGRQAARLTYEVFPVRRMVLLGNLDADGRVGEAGDVQGQGAARALMDEIDRRYQVPLWWIAADRAADHSPEGLAVMRGRRRLDRQWIHTSDCEDRCPYQCSCEFDEI